MSRTRSGLPFGQPTNPEETSAVAPAPRQGGRHYQGKRFAASCGLLARNGDGKDGRKKHGLKNNHHEWSFGTKRLGPDARYAK